ncbi:MAG: hypothetical protein MUC97_03310 [Bernardetiaceae bacterium]|jgi:hypothetical protein|nr:hypothetical protein [Bernardetiaceae bacterium]
MAYNKFKRLTQLREQFGLNDVQRAWLQNQPWPPEAVTDLLKIALQEAAQETLMTKKAKSEYIIVPMIKELRLHNVDKFKNLFRLRVQRGCQTRA